jgi:hypothetical protein
LAGLEWLDDAMRYPGSGTDMHWCAWGSDGALYVVDDDGANFGQPWNFAHFLRVTGMPPHHHVEEVSLFPDLKRPAGAEFKKRRYVAGVAAVGQRLYVAAYDYDSEEPGYEFWFLDHVSRHGGTVALMYSDDGGLTWQNTPQDDTPYFLGPNFAALQFVMFGPGYTGVPTWLDGYVYAISNGDGDSPVTGGFESGHHIFLARVPSDALLDRTAWEFYAGAGEGHVDGKPVWVRDEGAARPILTDPGHVGHPSMTYDPALQRFLLLTFSDVVPHTMDTPPEVARAMWDKRTELQLYEGPTPWGPWGLIHHDPAWEGAHAPYLPHIPPNWLSDDGLTGTMLYSGGWAIPGGHGDYYGFVTRPFRLLPGQQLRPG